MSTAARRAELNAIERVWLQVRRRWYCYAGMAITLGLLITFTYYPAFSAIYHSFTVWDGYRPARWVGLANYREIFTSPRFVQSFTNMVLLSGWTVIRGISFPLFAAALVYRMRRESWAYFFRLLFVLPIVVPTSVTVLIWQQLLDPNFGLFNDILKGLGLPTSLWLGDPKTALGSLMFVGFPWIGGVSLLIYLAGFLAIPSEIIEASIVDGASSWRRFFAIELPLILPQVRLLVILHTVGALQSFAWQLLVTDGGPMGSTSVPAWEMYSQAMRQHRFGTGSAIGVVLFLIIFSLTLINRTLIRSEVEFEAH